MIVMLYNFDDKNPLWKVIEGRVLKNGQILINDEIVQTWPDNDGGYWYYDKKGRMVTVHDD